MRLFLRNQNGVNLLNTRKPQRNCLKQLWIWTGGTVAEYIEKIHSEYVSTIEYNDENSLSSVLTIAYLSSMEYYFKPIRGASFGTRLCRFRIYS